MFLMVSMLIILLVFCFVGLRSVSCVPNMAGVSGVSILDCSFGFLQRLFRKKTKQYKYVTKNISGNTHHGNLLRQLF